MSQDVPSELLFGIVAFQLDFIDRDQLVTATKRWSQDKDNSLAEVLISLGAMDRDQCERLIPILQRHIQNHHGNAAESLQALSSIDSIVSQLRSVGDSEVEATLSLIGSGSESANSGLSAEFRVAAGPSSVVESRYRVLRPHARGGLGAVSVAKDQELNREVALKEILREHADNHERRARFLLEAEVTGALEHPGIVPVYGLGKYADGRPFYTMRFIHGDSLKQAVDRFHATESSGYSYSIHAVSFRKLLGRFLDVCDAIEYAHSRGVLHRDLKPGNIMLGRFGETLVVDWGLAKTKVADTRARNTAEPNLTLSSDSVSNPTVDGSVVGTPAFMSPEQARGDVEELGPASDVYSLGATLYYVMTGRVPYKEKELSRLLECVRQGTLQRPRQVNPSIPKALEAICLKAMALEPESRYESARHLADDLERWLADEPVLAYREPWSLRVRRWLRNHQTLVAITTMLLILAGLFSVIFAWQAERSRQQIAAEKERVDEARRIAEQNFGNALNAVELMLTRIGSDRLSTVPMMTDLRRQILQDAITFYEQSFANDLNRPEIRFQTARGNRLLAHCYSQMGNFDKAATYFQTAAEVYRQLAQTNPAHLPTRSELAATEAGLANIYGHQDQHAQALKHLDVAVAEYQQLATATRPKIMLDLLNALRLKADSLAALGNVTQARQCYDRQVELLGEIAQSGADEDESRYQQQAVQHNYGQFLLNQQNLREAISHLEQAAKLQEQTAAPLSSKPWILRDRANTQMSLGHAYGNSGEFEKARTCISNARGLYQSLHQNFPEVQSYRVGYFASFHNLGTILERMGRFDQAAEQFAESIKRLEDYAQRAELMASDRYDLANSYSHLGSCHTQLRQLDQAETAMRHSGELFQALGQEFPSVVRYRWMAAAERHNLAQLQVSMGRLDEAEQGFRAAIDLNQKLLVEFGEIEGPRRDLANSWMQLAIVLARIGQFTEADAAYSKAKIALNELCKSPDVPIEYLTTRAAAFHNHAMFLERQELLDQAQANYLDSIRHLENLLQSHPEVQFARRDLANSYLRLAGVQIELENLKSANESFGHAKANLEQLVQIPNPPVDAVIFWAATHHNHGLLLIQQSDIPNAIHQFDRSIEILRECATKNPNLAQARLDLASSYYVRGSIAIVQGDMDAAAEWLDACVALRARLVEQAPDEPEKRVLLREAELKHLVATGQLKEAEQAALKWAEESPLDPRNLQSSACVLALCALRHQQSDQNSSQDAVVRNTQETLRILRKIREQNELDPKHPLYRIDFSALADSPEFQEIMRMSDCLNSE